MAPEFEKKPIRRENGATVPQNSCSKCEKPLDSTGFPKWCMDCRAKYRREYDATKKEMAESRSFAAGMTAMREHLAKNFSQYGPAGFTGTEIARLILQVKGPTVA
jgi:hypothetical protein